MTIRQNIPKPEIGTEQLPNGYSGSDQPSDFQIPSCGIADVDESVFRLFDEELGFSSQKIIKGINGAVNIKKPIVIFATGERFAIVKKLRPVRDVNGALMLPAISIRRTAIEQSYANTNSMGINQTTGEYIIKRRLDSSDRDYQNLVNKLLINNANETSTRRIQGENSKDPSIEEGMLLDPKLGNNVFEIIAIPQPQFYSATYEIVYWTSFTEHMNYLIETTLSSQLPQGKMFKLNTSKGYWFIGYLDDSVQSQENIEDFKEDERIIRYSFTMKVNAWILTARGPGQPIPFKKYISATQFTFEEINDSFPVQKDKLDSLQDESVNSQFILTDINADSKTKQQSTSLERIVFQRDYIDRRTGKKKTKYVKITDSNMKRGETFYTASDQEVLADFLASKSSIKEV